MNAEEPDDELEQLVDHRLVRREGVRLHYAAAGEGPPVLLLHGFPDFWYSWRKQIPALARAGFRAIAPDLRGYNLSDKPSGVGAYRIQELADDVVAIAEDAGGAVSLVGHDWGGIISWLVAAQRPDLVERVAILNAPHIDNYARALLNPRQLLKSWYVFFFQIPWLPETVMRAVGAGPAKGLFGKAAARPEMKISEATRRYEEAFGSAQSWHAPINYYRAALRSWRPWPVRREREVTQPVLVVWGLNDRALEPALADPGPWAPNAVVHRLEDAGHWVHIEQAARVNSLLLEFLGSGAGGSATPDAG